MDTNDTIKKRLKNRIDRFCENKINAFSPTVSPAPKSPERNEIESISEAVRYFYQHNVHEIVVQRKYMGSYCDIYLFKDVSNTYFVSRNGYKINHIDLQLAKKSCRALHRRFNWDGLAMVIIQSELMPWSVLGKSLIENDFLGYLTVHKTHYQFLTHSDLYEKIEKVKQSAAYKAFKADRDVLTVKELAQKYPPHICRQYTSLSEFKVLDLNSYRENIAVYEEQINHFGREEAMYFKPFNVLKKVMDDGTELLVNDNLSYREINDDECLHFTIDSENAMENAIEQIYAWFDLLSSNMEEGIVIKPRTAFVRNLPPALKIRNNRYLTMIYGVDFQEKYLQHIQKRNIKRKLECSINDWMLNWEMLKIKYAEINKENQMFKNLTFDRIMGEQMEANLDIRL